MKSPFPGMDPYLEARWSDVRISLVVFITEALQPTLPSDLRARADVRMPDEDAGEWPTPHRFVKIIDIGNNDRVVTVVEILCPWIKAAGRSNRHYLEYLDEHCRVGVNVVEIDLLRCSREHLRVPSTDLPPSARTPYVTCVRKGWTSERWEVYPVGLREPIPRIPVPLRRTDAPVVLELQPVIDRIYRIGRHDDIDYRGPPVPPLAAEDEAWVDQLLRSAGKR